MIEIFQKCSDDLEEIFSLLEEKVEKPQPVKYAESFVYRYEKNTVEVALIQKLTRLITSLRAAIILLQNGYYQEVAVLQRVIDDIDEEITFLVYGKIMGNWGEIHEKYLEGFFAETFLDPSDPLTALDVKKPIVSRKTIRKFIDQSVDEMRKQGAVIDKNVTESSHIVSKVFNGFTHAGSPQILDMYAGYPPHYHLKGMLGTPREKENIESLWNQFFRGSLAFELVCSYFTDKELLRKAQIVHDKIRTAKDFKCT